MKTYRKSVLLVAGSVALMMALSGCDAAVAGAADGTPDPQDFDLKGTVEAISGDSVTLNGQTVTVPGLGAYLDSVHVGDSVEIKVDMEDGAIADVEISSANETPEATDVMETPEATETLEPMETPDATETLEPMETPEATEASDSGDNHSDESHDSGDNGSDD